MDVVERVGRAALKSQMDTLELFKRPEISDDDTTFLDFMSWEKQREMWEPIARAAIAAALREPTEAMCTAVSFGMSGELHLSDRQIKMIADLMCDAALNTPHRN